MFFYLTGQHTTRIVRIVMTIVVRIMANWCRPAIPGKQSSAQPFNRSMHCFPTGTTSATAPPPNMKTTLTITGEILAVLLILALGALLLAF
jgi:hypothetical protein